MLKVSNALPLQATPPCFTNIYTRAAWLGQELHVDQVLAWFCGATGCSQLIAICFIFAVVLIVDGFRAAVRVAVVIKETSEGELVEGVFGVLPVAEPTIQGVVVVALCLATPAFHWVHGVEIGGVRGVGDGGNVGRRLLP